MDKAVSAADANRRHGKPLAKITPVVEDERLAERARAALFARLRAGRAVNAGRWTRDELYDASRNNLRGGNERSDETRRWI